MDRIEVDSPWALIEPIDSKGRPRGAYGTLDEPVVADIFTGVAGDPYATITIYGWGPTWVRGEIAKWPLSRKERVRRYWLRAWNAAVVRWRWWRSA